MFIDFLQNFTQLTPAEQKVFLFCLKNNPYPRQNSNDLNFIAFSLGLSYKTTWRAVHAISSNKHFNKLVRYISTDISSAVIDWDCYNVIAEGPLGGDFLFGEAAGACAIRGDLQAQKQHFLSVNVSLSPPLAYKVVDYKVFTADFFTFSTGICSDFELEGRGGDDPGGTLRNVILPRSPLSKN
jgi:hypothetical protein